MKQFLIVKDAEALAKTAASFLTKQIQRKPKSCLSLATGSTPKRTYQLFAQKRVEECLDLSQMHFFHLDEYVGFAQKDPRSFAFYIRENVVVPWDLKDFQVSLWQGDGPDPLTACTAYEKSIKNIGGIDCQILGLGINGHIGFNEPGSLKESCCRVVALTEETLHHNKKDLEGGVLPTHALTMGIANILEARNLLLLVTGKNKTESLKNFLREEVNPDHPASFLKEHDHLTVIVDQAALADLKINSEVFEIHV